MRGLAAQTALEQALEEHHPGIALACSFQKEETVLLHMLLQAVPDPRVFTIDTGVLFPETYATWRELEQRFGVKVEVFDATSPGAPWTAENCCGTRRWRRSTERSAGSTPGSRACGESRRRPARPLRRALGTRPAGSGSSTPWSIGPSATCGAYISEHDLPYNPLHDQGYASIGCAPCTSPGSGREGRWAGSDKTECGLHVT